MNKRSKLGMYRFDWAPEIFIEWYFDMKRGNCFRFNSNKQFEDWYFDIDNIKTSFFLELYSGQPSAFRVSDGNGFNIELKKSDGYPAIFNSFLIDVGTFTDIVISPIRSKSLPKPYSDCVDIDTYSSPLYTIMKQLNITYSREKCLDVYTQKLVSQEFGCYSTRF